MAGRKRTSETDASWEAEALRAMFDRSPVPMWIKDAAGRFVMANQACIEVFGGVDPVGSLEIDLVDGASARQHMGNDRAAAEGRASEFEETVGTGGARRTFMSAKFPVAGPNGQTLVCGVATEVTERRRSEEGARLLAEAGRVLSGTLALDTALESVARLAVPVLGDACSVDLVEAGELKRTALWTGDEAEALHWFAAEPPSLESSDRPAAEAVRTGRPALVDVAGPGTDLARRALGALGMRSVLSVPLKGRLGTVGALSLAAKSRRYGAADVDLAEALAQMAADAVEAARFYLEAKLEAARRERLMAAVGHDLRSPLAAVIAGAEVLVARGQDGAAEAIARAARRAARLTSDLLDAAAARDGRLTVRMRPCRLPELLQEAVEQHEAEATRKKVRVEVGECAPSEAMCDRDRVVQVVSNLIGNAIKFTGTGGAVRIRSEPDGRHAKVTVEDNGTGMKPEELVHLFDEWWTAGRPGSGTGLGLFVSKGLVEAHGGRIWAESEPGRGTSVHFTIPRS